MYLTFLRENQQFISASNKLSFESDIDLEGIVYYDDLIIIENRPDVEFIETYFDEVKQTEEIASDQFVFESFKRI